MAKEQRYVIGIDIGGTKVMAVLFDAQFRPLGKFRTKTRPNEGEKHFIRILRDAVRQLLRDAELNRDEILGIGVGCPGMPPLPPAKMLDEPRAASRMINASTAPHNTQGGLRGRLEPGPPLAVRGRKGGAEVWAC